MAITPIWMAGMEFGDLREFDNTSGAPVASTTVKRTGAYSLRGGNVTNQYADVNFVSGQCRIGFHISPTANGVSGTRASYVKIMNGTTVLAGISINTGGTVLELMVSGAVVATTTAPTFNILQNWGLDWKQHATAGWAKFYIDGVLMLEYAGNTGGLTSTIVRWLPSGTNAALDAYTYIDDMYIDDTAGQTTPAPPPDKRFPFFASLVDSATTQFTPSAGTNHAALLSDIPPVDTEYVEAGAAGLQELFALPAITIPPGFSVAALWPVAQALKTDGGMDTRLKFYTKKATAAAVTGADLALPTSPGVVTERFDGEWTEAEMEAGTFGVESAGAFA